MDIGGIAGPFAPYGTDCFKIACRAAGALADEVLARGEDDGAADFSVIFPTTGFPRGVGLRNSDC